MEDTWSGLINNFAFQIVNPDPDAVVYIEEIALFADQESAYVYAGLANEDTTAEAPTEAPTDDVTEAPTEDATEAPTDEVTEAPAESTAEESTEEAEGGCGAVMGLGLLAVLGAAYVTLKKEHD
jgi:hypothetical protein